MSLENIVERRETGIMNSFFNFIVDAGSAIYKAKQVIDEYFDDKEAAKKEEPELTKNYIEGLYSRFNNDKRIFTEAAKTQYGMENGHLVEAGKERVNLRLERRYFEAIEKLEARYDLLNIMAEEGEVKLDLPNPSKIKFNILTDFYKERSTDFF